ncbi:Protein kinase-like domain containing protein [Lactarius tabidus]
MSPSPLRLRQPLRKRTNPIEQAEGYTRTRACAIEAIGSALGAAASIGHEVLFTGVDLLQFAPVPGLDLAGKILLSIWDAVDMVEANRAASLRLIERCADILISIRDEIADAGDTVTEELRAPIKKLVKSFEEVRSCLNKLGQCSFLKRYLRRNEILSDISDCHTTLDDARETFNTSIQIRTLKLVKATELRQQDLLESLEHVSPSLPLARPFLPPALQSFPTDPESVRNTLRADRACDMADLHKLMRAALAAKDDVAMFEVFQIARNDMPEAIKTLERTLKRDVHAEELDAEDITMALASSQEAPGRVNGPPLDPGNASANHSSANTLDREFIVTGIEALRRLSKGADLGLPSWTITWLEVELEKQVGFGSFSDVYRGTWRKRTVAVKVLDKTTPPKIFLREVKIWKSLNHPNVLKLFGASSASGDPPWFLVCKYYPQGNLVKYLKGLSHADPTRIDAVKMIHEISKGMAYLHGQGVLHGDLKAANILVDDDTSCVISDFGQSEMKSEVYRITCAPQLRGTLRWQAPELMEGAQTLTPEMDVYAFAICCWEILKMGALPWPLADDSAVRYYVLSVVASGHLMDLIRTSWDSVPSKRPPFEEIASELKKQRGGRRVYSANSQTPSKQYTLHFRLRKEATDYHSGLLTTRFYHASLRLRAHHRARMLQTRPSPCAQ